MRFRPSTWGKSPKESPLLLRLRVSSAAGPLLRSIRMASIPALSAPWISEVPDAARPGPRAGAHLASRLALELRAKTPGEGFQTFPLGCPPKWCIWVSKGNHKRKTTSLGISLILRPPHTLGWPFYEESEDIIMIDIIFLIIIIVAPLFWVSLPEFPD